MIPHIYLMHCGPARQSDMLSAVSVGPTHCQARGPFWLALGRVRPMADLGASFSDAEEMDRAFMAPQHQWGAVAQGVNE